MTAATHWAEHDPHRRAFTTLYSQRSLEIYLNLNPSQRKVSEIGGSDYGNFLRQRCLGCHATPTATTNVGEAEQFSDDLRDHLDGVTCASCHGAADQWLDRHYLREWPAGADRRRVEVDTSLGFVDLKQLPIRARVCAGCHVGSADAGRTGEIVDHELTAAGHPRLRFELDAYLANLPAHWDRQRDAQQHAKRTGGHLHLDAWRVGRAEAMRRLASRWPARDDARSQEPVDFAALRCDACHHRIAHVGITPPAGRSVKSNGSPAFPIARALPFEESFVASSAQPARLATHAAYIVQMFERSEVVNAMARQAGRWEECVDVLLAAESLVAAMLESDVEQVRAAADGLQAVTNEIRTQLTAPMLLGAREDKHSTRLLTVYDSPTYFDATSVREALSRLRVVLTSLEQVFAKEERR